MMDLQRELLLRSIRADKSFQSATYGATNVLDGQLFFQIWDEHQPADSAQAQMPRLVSKLL